MASSAARDRESAPNGRLELFGGFRLEVDGAAVQLTVGAQRLLAYLALQGLSPRATVAGTLWAEVPEERALGNLRTAVWRINRAEPGLVAVQRDQLALAAFVATDVVEFTDWATAGFADPDDLGGRLGPLPDPRVRDLLPGWYDDWVVFERDRVRQLQLHALEHTSGGLRAGGQYALALDLALAAVQGEPLRESARRAVMLVHLAEGNFAAAVDEYRCFSKLLAAELGVPPSRDLAGLVTGCDYDDRFVNRMNPTSRGPTPPQPVVSGAYQRVGGPSGGPLVAVRARAVGTDSVPKPGRMPR